MNTEKIINFQETGRVLVVVDIILFSGAMLRRELPWRFVT